MQSIQKINVDISRDRNLSEPSVYAKQNDSNSRKVEVTLFDSGVQLSSLTAPGKVFFGKGNNSYVETIEITNGVTEFIIPQNALSSSGRIQAEILILNDTDTETLTSATFIINCHAQINPSGAITGENNGDILGQVLERIEQIQASNMSRTPLPDGAIDLNTFITSGWWYTTEQRIDITNTPKDLAELELIVTKDVLSITQILIACDGGYGICYRFSHNSGKNWTDWQKIATDADVSTATNLVNGSAEGSLRGIDARAEDDDYTIGQNAVAIGYSTKASGHFSHAEGDHTAASGNRAHAEGNSTLASGDSSHAEGIETRATGEYSHAEGFDTRAENRGAHAEGVDTIANGSQSHAEGKAVKAYGDFSHAEGLNTIASGYCQHAQGKFNIEDTNNRYAHIVGNGEDEENRSNAHTLDWDGNAWFAGDVYVGGTSQDDESATKLSSVATDIMQVKEKLDGIEEGANKTIVDTALSMTSTNPIQNKAVAERIKNHASFLARTFPTDAVYLKLGTFIGDGLGGRAILTINGRKYWNTYEDGGLKVLTLSSSSSRINGTFYDFGTSNNNTNSTHYKTDDMEMLIVCQKEYALTKADVFIKFTTSCQYNSYFVTVDYSEGCSWVTDVQAITSTDTDPTTDAQSYHTAPIKYIGDAYELRTPKEKAALISHTAPYCQSELKIDDFTKLNDYRTIIGTISGTNDWNNIISVRHRNGADDGSNYGMYLRSKLTSKSNLIWRQQTSSGWESEKTLLDSSNFTNYIPYETGTCTLTAYSNTVFGAVSNEILLNWASDTSKYYTTGSTNADGTLTVQGTGNARIINAYNINATGTVGVEFAVSGTGAIKIEIKGGGTTYTSGNISLSTNTQKIQITHATSGIAVLDDMEINIYASGETALKIENLLKMTEASTRTLTGTYDLIGNQVTISVFVDNLQNGGEIALYPLPFVPKIAKSGVCGAFSSSPYSAIYYEIYGGTTAMIYLNDAPQANKQLTFYYTV